MGTTILAFTLSLGLLATTGAAPVAPSSDPETPYRGAGDPPAGPAADQELWRAARDASNEVVIAQHAAARLQHEAKRAQLVERLSDPARRGGLPQDRAEALAKRLQERWLANVALMSAPWPVSKTRGCQYELLNLEGVMLSGPSPRRDAQLEDTRRAVRDCVDRATAAISSAHRSTEELRAAIGEVERAIGPVAAAPAAKK